MLFTKLSTLATLFASTAMANHHHHHHKGAALERRTVTLAPGLVDGGATYATTRRALVTDGDLAKRYMEIIDTSGDSTTTITSTIFTTVTLSDYTSSMVSSSVESPTAVTSSSSSEVSTPTPAQTVSTQSEIPPPSSSSPSSSYVNPTTAAPVTPSSTAIQLSTSFPSLISFPTTQDLVNLAAVSANTNTATPALTTTIKPSPSLLSSAPTFSSSSSSSSKTTTNTPRTSPKTTPTTKLPTSLKPKIVTSTIEVSEIVTVTTTVPPKPTSADMVTMTITDLVIVSPEVGTKVVNNALQASTDYVTVSNIPAAL